MHHPTPWVPAAHDVVTVLVKPFSPRIRLTWEVAMLGRIMGKKNGLSRIPPRVSTVRPPILNIREAAAAVAQHDPQPRRVLRLQVQARILR